MSRCSSCGSEFEGKFCPFCGAVAVEESPAIPQPISATEMNSYQQPQNGYYQQPQGYAPPPVYNNTFNNVQAEDHTTIGGWIGWLLLCSFLPIIGHIIMLCTAKNKTIKNFVIAQFILLGISIVLTIILFLVFGGILVALGESMTNY